MVVEGRGGEERRYEELDDFCMLVVVGLCRLPIAA